MIYDLIIIGCGASGSSCAISYKRNKPNKSVLILEKEDEILKKVNASGNGKGNFTNDFISFESYNSKYYVKSVFKDDPKTQVLSFFDSLNLAYYKDHEGRYYPNSNSAKSISYVLKREMDKLGVEVKLSTKVDNIEKDEDTFLIKTNNGIYESKSLVIATGAKNYKTLGSDGSIYPIAKKLGHSLTKLYPANIYIKVFETDITKKLSGLRFDATIYLVNNGEVYYHEKGEVLFKDNAISGIVTFNISNRLAYLYKNDECVNPELIIDYCNKIDTEDIVNSIYNSKDPKETLMGLVHPTLANLIYDISDTNKDIVINLLSMKFKVKELGDFDHAQITAGGIDTKELKSTLESNIVDNLYFIGDVIDVDAACGGFNLSFAFISGIKAGENIE